MMAFGDHIQTAAATASGITIKICGLTSEAAVEAAVAAGADRIGFVFSRSPREVTPQRAAALCAGLPDGVARVAVMRRASQDEVDEVLAAFPADWLQADAASLRGIVLPAEVRAMPVIRDGETPDLSDVPAVLYEAPVSGRGVRADWAAAARLARRHWLMLAGGLDSANVAEAIAAVGPAGVDVSSGVESARGVKDPDRIHAFVSAAREAARRVATVTPGSRSGRARSTP